MGTPSFPVHRYPLHLTISAAFTALLLVLGVTLIGFNYVESRRIATLGADAALERGAAAVAANAERLYRPARNLVDLTAHVLEPARVSPAAASPETVELFREALDRNRNLSSVYLASIDGDFLLVRPLPTRPDVRYAAEAPGNAAWIVQRIHLADGVDPSESVAYLDAAGRTVGARTVGWSGYDPRTRGWYREAIATPDPVTSDFYVFYTTGDVGLTLARRTTDGAGVVGADLALSDLELALAGQRPTPSSEIVILGPDRLVVALSDPDLGLPATGDRGAEQIEPPHLGDLEAPLYAALADLLAGAGAAHTPVIESEGRRWRVETRRLPTRVGTDLDLALLVPEDELLAGVIRIRDRSVLLSAGLLAVALVVGVALARNVSRSLRALAAEAEDIRALRLGAPLEVRSSILEVDELATTMSGMKSSLQQFLSISHALSAEKDFGRLLEMILDEALRVTAADAGAILLRDENDEVLEVAVLRNTVTGDHLGGTSGRRPELEKVALGGATPPEPETLAVSSGTPRLVDDLDRTDLDLDVVRLRERFGGDEAGLRSLLCVPLRTPQDEVIGVLELVDARDAAGVDAAFGPEFVAYVEALSSDAAVALDNRRLLEARKALLDSFILVVAGAIDAKSPYTHGHCQRVPEIAGMLAEAAHETDHGTFADFRLSDDEWEELHLASWLHDCGKVTTPEYVVDKSTKLETLCNRIHEIRTRFEVLWRDAEIDHLRGALDRPDDEPGLRAIRDARREELRDDFAFIARCNLGDEPLSDADVERIRRIGATTWMRHFDDRAGLSHLELARRAPATDGALPATETLLADKPEHLVRREPGTHPFGDDQHGFRMEVPDNLYDLGEITNLSIRRGTLTPEERFKINEHIIQTLRMLGQLPFPRELRRVPEWAGNHHEKLDGTGYPRRLAAHQLAVPDRIMAVADVFEALTASDRPYMTPKTLSRAVTIMASMSADGHLCPDLFELMLRHGVHERYADRHLRPEQLDEVDVEAAVRVARRRTA